MALGPFGPVPEMGTSFGLGFAVRVDPGRNPRAGLGRRFLLGRNHRHALLGGSEGEAGGGDDGAASASCELNVIWRQTRTMVYQALIN